MRILTGMQAVFFSVIVAISPHAFAQECVPGSWATIPGAGLPYSLAGGMMAYDEARQEMIYFGGINFFLPGDDDHPEGTWRWNGATWSLVTRAGPTGRRLGGMAYDSHRERIVKFGGHSYCGGGCNFQHHETWEWNGTQWNEVFTATVPYSSDGSMAFDPIRNVCVYWGSGTEGSPMHTWEYDGVDWTLRSTSAVMANGNLAFDHARGKVIRFGGVEASCPSNRMWEWDGTTWQEIGSVYRPWGRVTDLVSDPARKRVIAFGGAHNCDGIQDMGDTWEWDGNSWSMVSPGGPATRAYHAAAFDTNRGVMVMYGGIDYELSTLFLNDTWEWTPPTLACPGDANCDAAVNVTDLLAIIGAWGACPALPTTCPADVAPFNGDSVVNVTDLLAVVGGWGPCP